MPERICHVVRYSGPFGFMKPWTAVRDTETYSQQFLTPSMVEGIRQKLEVDSILRHKISHCGFSRQQERIESRGFGPSGKSRSILTRGVLLTPNLYLVFSSKEDASKASIQHVCLSRNEDLLLPVALMALSELEFDAIEGFELRFGKTDRSFLVGYNRFNGEPMYGYLEVTGEPTVAVPIEI